MITYVLFEIANLSDVNDVQLKYNAYDDIVFAKDNHMQVAFDYTILGSLISREQCGKKVKFTRYRGAVNRCHQ